MPVVPTYNPGQVQQQVGPTVRRSVDAPIEAFGGGISRATDAAGGVLDQVSKIAMREKEKQDDIRVQDAYARGVARKNERFWDPKTGAVTRKGKDAAGVMDEYGKAFQADLDEIEESLGNADQKAQFAQIRSRLSADLNDNLIKHSYQEGEKFAEETHKSVIDNIQNDTVLNFATPGKVQEGLNLQRAKIVDYAAKHGKDGEWVKSTVEEQTSKLHLGVLNQMLTAKQDMAAKEYFDQHKDEFDADAKAKAQAAVREGYTQGEAQRQASALYNPKKENLREALAEARKNNKDPDVQKAVVDEIKVRHSETEAIRKDGQERLFRWASNYVSTNKQLPPPDKMVQMSLNEQQALKQYLAAGVETNWTVYEDLRDKAANPATRDEFLGLELSKQYAKDLNKSELEKLIDLKAMIRQGDEKTLQALDGIQDKNSIVKGIMVSAGIEVDSKDEVKRGRESAFRDLVDREIEARQAQTGKKITNADVSEIAQDLAIKEVVEKRTLFGFDWLRQDVTKVTAEIQVDDIPAADRKLIEAAIKKRGVQPTPAAFIHYYMQLRKERRVRGIKPTEDFTSGDVGDGG